MRRLITALIAALIAACPAPTLGVAAADRPNIVVILVDDMGFSDIGCYGSEIPTPHLDRLAAGGLRFTQFYNSARCSPTRAALLTGLNPHQAGMGWLDSRVEPSSRGIRGKLLPRCVTIAEVLRDAGYFTAMTGKWHLGQATYAAMVECIDRSVGTLVAGLERRGLLDDTLILFMSDNGGNAEGGPPGVTKGEGPIGGPGSYVLLGMNWATLNNTPFTSYKHFTHEGGISSPLIARWPRGIDVSRRGTLVKEPTHLIDLMPTAVDLGRAAYPESRGGVDILPPEGVSLRPAFAGGGLGRPRPLFWEHEGNKAVRDGRWKLVAKWQKPWELYDIETDRVEQRDLAAEKPQLVADMAAAWKAWAERTFVDEWSEPGPPKER